MPRKKTHNEKKLMITNGDFISSVGVSNYKFDNFNPEEIQLAAIKGAIRILKRALNHRVQTVPDSYDKINAILIPGLDTDCISFRILEIETNYIHVHVTFNHKWSLVDHIFVNTQTYAFKYKTCSEQYKCKRDLMMYSQTWQGQSLP